MGDYRRCWFVAGACVEASVGGVPRCFIKPRGVQGLRTPVRDDRRHPARRTQVSEAPRDAFLRVFCYLGVDVVRDAQAALFTRNGDGN